MAPRRPDAPRLAIAIAIALVGCGGVLDGSVEPVEPEVLAEGDEAVADMSRAGEMLFWTAVHGEVSRMDSSGGHVELLATDASPTRIAAAERPNEIQACWLREGGISCVSSAFQPTEIPSDEELVALAVHEGVAYFVAGPADARPFGRIRRAVPGGAPPEMVLEGVFARDLAVLGSFVYSNDTTRLIAAPLEGGRSAILADLVTSSVLRLALDDSAAFIGGDRGLHRVDLATGAVLVLADSNRVTALAVNSRSVFFATAAGLRRVPRDGGADDILAIDPHIVAVAADEERVYWASGRRILALPSGASRAR